MVVLLAVKNNTCTTWCATYSTPKLQGLEKYLMTKLYGKVFAVSESDKERDEALARRMEVHFTFQLLQKTDRLGMLADGAALSSLPSFLLHAH